MCNLRKVFSLKMRARWFTFVIIRRSKIFLVLCNRLKDKFSKGLRGILRNSELCEFRICGIDGLLWARTIVPAWIVSSVTMSRFHLPVSHIRATLYVTDGSEEGKNSEIIWNEKIRHEWKLRHASCRVTDYVFRFQET